MLVVRMVRKNTANKTLIRQDGKQFAAQVGMVDRNGVMFNVVDDGSKYLEFHPMSWIVQDMESEIEHIKVDLAITGDACDRAIDLLGRACELCDDLIANGTFKRGDKTPYKERLYKLKAEHKRMAGR